MSQKFTFFVDVDNTLLNNDLVKTEIKEALIAILGEVEAEHFWQHHDEFRSYQKLVDFPAITRQYCAEKHSNQCEMVVGSIFTGIKFAHALYPKTIEALRYLKTLGTVLIFSEGDMVYQKMKIEQSGIADATDSVLLFTQKLDHLSEAVSRYQDTMLVFIDDRDDKLMAIKQQLPKAVTIVVCQGHYAKPDCIMEHSADKVVGSVAEMIDWSRDDFIISTHRA